MNSTTLGLLSSDPALIEYWTEALPATAPVHLAGPSRMLLLSPGTVVLVDLSAMESLVTAADNWGELASQYRLVAASTYPRDEEGLAAIGGGAVGYCHAYAAPATLKQVVSVVSAGGLWVGESLLAGLIGAVGRALQAVDTTSQQGVLGRLTEREQQVARAVAEGATNKAIARALDITERTVKAHLTSIFGKLGVHDRLQLSLKLNVTT